MIELDDCGKELLLGFGADLEQIDTKAIMVIKAPRGTMAIFSSRPDRYYQGYYQLDRCEGIKAFMEEHRHDQT